MRFIVIFLFFFHTAVFAQHYETRLLRASGSDTVSLWETVEIGIRAPAQERLYRNFLSDHSRGINPYASRLLRVQFVCNGATYEVPAFYVEDAAADEQQNRFVTQPAEWPWRVRFAVPRIGRWQCNLLIGESVAQAVPQPCNVSFYCKAGNRHGYLHTAQQHFVYSDGTPFFAIGQNIPWADEPVLHGHPGKLPQYVSAYSDVFHALENLADNGGNYVRIVMAHWSTGIEWEEAGVYAQDRAFALDSMLRIAERRGLQVHLCLDLTTGFDPGTPKSEWSPYRRAFQKEGMTAADLLRDPAAIAMFDQFFRYVHARWAYSPAVATIELVGEQNRWEGYEGKESYFRNFFIHVDSLLRYELKDRDHLLSTSNTNIGHTAMFSNSAVSFIDIHYYDNDFRCNQKRYDAVHLHSLEKLDKPFFIGEMGMINGPVNACDPNDLEACSDVSFHNALWSTAFMGTLGTGLNWWQWTDDKRRETNFPALRWFMDSVAQNFSGYISGEWDGNGLETFYQVSNEKYDAFGWVHNTSYWWANMTPGCRDRDGKTMVHPKDDDKPAQPVDRAGNHFTLSGLAPHTKFVVIFYDTRRRATEISRTTVKTNRLGRVKVPMPAGADAAFRVKFAGVRDF